jgi:hypothetical protein
MASYPGNDNLHEEYCRLGYNAMLSVESQSSFRRKISLPSSGRRISRTRNQRASRWQAELFDPEDGGDMFLRNVG